MMAARESKTVFAEGIDIFKAMQAMQAVPALLLALVVPAMTAGAAKAPASRPAERPPSGAAGRLIAHYRMQRIPQEGAWYAVTYTSGDVLDGALLPPRYAGRPHAAGGAIVALVTARDFSALHRLTTDEVWHFYGGAPLELLLLYPDGKGRSVTLGSNVLRGELAQFTVPAGVWQGGAPVGAGYGVPAGAPNGVPVAGSADRYSFVGTQMAPAFDPSDFEIGYRDALTRQYPAFAKTIRRLTRSEFATVADKPADRPDPRASPARAFTAADVPAATPTPGVTLQELVGRVAPLSKTSMFSIAKFTLSPGHSSGSSFNHRAQEVFLVIDGTGEVHLGDQVTAVNAESTVFIPAGEVHSIEADPNSTLTFYAVSAPAFSPEDYVAVKPK